jgi:hypothetical protein
MTDADHRRRPDDVPSRRVSVGVLTDPGLAAILADRLRDVLPERLRAEVDDGVTWHVDTMHEPFEAMYPDYNPLVEKAREHVRDTGWDLVVCITDQPMPDGASVMVADLHVADRVAVISLPALGGWHLRRRLSTTVVAIVGYLAAPPGSTALAELRRQLSSRTTRVEGPGSPHLHVARRRGVPHLLAGMVRVNRPWQLLRGLSTALAGALTGIAFGVLYSTIWTLADSLSPVRLAGLTAAAVATMTVWIIVSHELWERSQGGHDPDIRLRNASTVITVAAGSAAFFVAMFAVALAAVALVVPPSYLAATLGHPVGVADYAVIALMASVLGAIAGAVGSGLEDDITVREATYGYRARERREIVLKADKDVAPPRR